MKLDALSEKLGVEINRELLKLAMTHRSYSYEHGNIPNNERLEFLGDSVLGFVVTSHIYETLTNLPEGEMTKVKNAVVSARALAVVAAELSLGEYLLLGKGELATDGRNKPNLLADAFEAILGAAYMSNGFDAARTLVEKFVFPLLDNPDEIRANSDPKTTLAGAHPGVGSRNTELQDPLRGGQITTATISRPSMSTAKRSATARAAPRRTPKQLRP
jgi:ribonuclease III